MPLAHFSFNVLDRLAGTLPLLRHIFSFGEIVAFFLIEEHKKHFHINISMSECKPLLYATPFFFCEIEALFLIEKNKKHLHIHISMSECSTILI